MTKDKITIIRISGGLGNQLFQYAVGKTLSIKNKMKLFLDISFYNTNTLDTKRDFLLSYYNTANMIAGDDEKKILVYPI